VNFHVTFTRWAIKAVVNGINFTSISRVKSPQLTIYFRPFIGAPFHSIDQ